MDTIPHQLARIERKLDQLLERIPAPQADGGFAYTETPQEKTIRESAPTPTTTTDPANHVFPANPIPLDD